MIINQTTKVEIAPRDIIARLRATQTDGAATGFMPGQAVRLSPECVARANTKTGATPLGWTLDDHAEDLRGIVLGFIRTNDEIRIATLVLDEDGDQQALRLAPADLIDADAEFVPLPETAHAINTADTDTFEYAGARPSLTP